MDIGRGGTTHGVGDVVWGCAFGYRIEARWSIRTIALDLDVEAKDFLAATGRTVQSAKGALMTEP